MYFDEDTLICTLISVRWMYFVGADMQCSRDIDMHRSRDIIASILLESAVVSCLGWLGLTAVSLILIAVSLSLTGVRLCWSRDAFLSESILLRSQIPI